MQPASAITLFEGDACTLSVATDDSIYMMQRSTPFVKILPTLIWTHYCTHAELHIKKILGYFELAASFLLLSVMHNIMKPPAVDFFPFSLNISSRFFLQRFDFVLKIDVIKNDVALFGFAVN